MGRTSTSTDLVTLSNNRINISRSVSDSRQERRLVHRCYVQVCLNGAGWRAFHNPGVRSFTRRRLVWLDVANRNVLTHGMGRSFVLNTKLSCRNRVLTTVRPPTIPKMQVPGRFVPPSSNWLCLLLDTFWLRYFLLFFSEVVSRLEDSLWQFRLKFLFGISSIHCAVAI